MKKLLLILSLVVAVIVLAACGGGATPAAQPTAPPAPTQPPAPPPTEEPAAAPTDLGGKEIRIAVENAYPPFNFIDEATNEPDGWDYEAWREICSRLNCKPVFVEAAWEGLFEAMQAGQYDVAADGITITEERDKIIDYSIPYLEYGQVILARANESNITDKDSLINSDAVVGVQLGTTNENTAMELVGESRVKSFDTFDTPVAALITGDVDAVIIDKVAAVGFMGENPGKLKMAGDVTSGEFLGFVFPPGSDLIAPVNAALEAMKADGTLEQINKKWFEPEPEAAAMADLGGKEVRIAVENAYPPFNFIDEATNEPDGWDYEAWREICSRLNCKPVFVEAAWEGLFEAMQAGQYDVAADGITITEERDKIIDYSIPYLEYGQVILARANESNITDKDSLINSDAVVGVQLGTTNENTAMELVGESRVKSFDTFDTPVAALITGDVDAVIIDKVAAVGFMGENPGKLKMAGDVTSGEFLGFVFPPGSDLIAPVNAALEAMKADGTLEQLNKKWFEPE